LQRKQVVLGVVLGGLVVHTEQLTTADAFWLVTILG